MAIFRYLSSLLPIPQYWRGSRARGGADCCDYYHRQERTDKEADYDGLNHHHALVLSIGCFSQRRREDARCDEPLTTE